MKFESWTTDKSRSKCISVSFYSFLKEIWTLKSGNSLKSPAHYKQLIISSGAYKNETAS